MKPIYAALALIALNSLSAHADVPTPSRGKLSSGAAQSFYKVMTGDQLKVENVEEAQQVTSSNGSIVHPVGQNTIYVYDAAGKQLLKSGIKATRDAFTTLSRLLRFDELPSRSGNEVTVGYDSDFSITCKKFAGLRARISGAYSCKYSLVD